MDMNGCRGCAEYQALSRRQFLAGAGGAALAVGVPAWLPRIAFATDFCSSRDVIIAIFLRGASDGLTLCVPHQEAAYYALRPTLAIQPPDSSDPFRAIDLDGFFGFPPAMAPLLTAYDAGHLLIVHACGSTDASRSHFEAQRSMEVGKPGDQALYSGWLGRHLAGTNPDVQSTILRGVGIATGLQRCLQSAPATLPIPSLDAFGLSGSASTRTARSAVLADMYALIADPLKAAAQTTQATITLLDTIDFANYAPGGSAVYPAGNLGTALKSTAALIKADVGVEAVAIDVGGWDTHNNQGPTQGTMATLMTSLAGGLAAFHADMFARNGRNFVVAIQSEFGRRPLENGSLGSDHGHGNAMMLLGNHIAGGRVLANWPGLAPGQLFQDRDLEVTIDFRDILAEIVQYRLANTDLGSVFPGYTPTFRGATRSAQPGDFDCDGDVDTLDVQRFEACGTGPTVPESDPTCASCDFDGDHDVDGDDFAVLQRCQSGQGQPSTPNCAG